MTPKVGTGVAIINAKNQILLAKRKGSHGEGQYGLAGGHLEFGETLEACAVREVEEETGLIVHTLQPIMVGQLITCFKDKHYIDFGFVTYEWEGTPKVCEPNKVEGEWQWYDLNKLPSPLFPTVELYIAAIKEKRFIYVNKPL